MDDICLANLIVKGDQKAFEVFFERYYKVLLAFIMTFTHDYFLADDIVQQAFIKFWQSKGSLDKQRSLKNFLYTIAHNLYIDHYRKQKRFYNVYDELKESAFRDTMEEDAIDFTNKYNRINKIIDTLPKRCKIILKMSKVDGFTYSEIAEDLGISIKTVESQIRIAFKKIRLEYPKDHQILVLILSKFL